MKKLTLMAALLLGLSACSEPGTFKPMDVHPAVPGVIMGVTACAVTGACVLP